jgi:Serine kinase of the HPr protein, regulates carbohydrate metabolism
METKYLYRVYGLNVESEIHLPELIPISQKLNLKIDVSISYGNIPEDIDNAIERENYYKISKNQFIFNVEGVADYYVYNGCNIIVQPARLSSIDDIRIFLLGTAFGVLLIQRDCIALHGGTVDIDGQGVMIIGDRGSGKSTLTSSLRMKGYKLLSDDVSVICKSEKDGFDVCPAYPQQKLCEDIVNLLNFNRENYETVYYDKNKYKIPIINDFNNQPIPLTTIYELNIGECESAYITEVKGLEKIGLIMKNIYRFEFLMDVGASNEYLKECINIAKSIMVYKICRPRGIICIEEQINLIRSTMGNEKSDFEMR